VEIKRFLNQKGSVAMLASEDILSFKSYQNRANLFVKEYLLADSLIPYTSVISGMLACKMVSRLQYVVILYFSSRMSYKTH